MKQRSALPKKATLDAFLDYNPETGVFIWKVTRGSRAKAGTRAGAVWTSDNRRRITVEKQNYMSYRLAWYLVHGLPMPENIYHKDGDTTNDAIDNLTDTKPDTGDGD